MNDDLISRQAAIDALGERPVVWSDNDDYTLGERNQYDMDRLAIDTVPSAEPQKMKGKWVYGEHDIAMCDGYMCNQCGFFVPWDYKHKSIDFIKDYHWCPSCGADMRGEQDG